jgi:hypothetical protein
MVDLKEVSDEDLNRPGPFSLTDEIAAEKLGLPVERMLEIMKAWEESAFEVAKERQRRRKFLASPKRTVL